MKRTRDDVCAASQFKRPFGSSRGESFEQSGSPVAARVGSKGGGGSRGAGGGVGAEAAGGGAPMAAVGGGGDNLQKLTTNDALTYLKEVKQMFQDQKEKYETFLEVMKDFKAQRADTATVIARVKELFKGHNNLIYGFNTFLPKGYEITLDEDEAPPKKTVEFKEAISFVNKIKKRFQNDDHVYKSFLDILNMYRTEHKDIQEVFIEVASLFVGHPDLLEEFTKFLPKSSANPSASQVLFGKNALQRHNERSSASPMMRQILTDNQRHKDKIVGLHNDRDLGVDPLEMDNGKSVVNMQKDQSKLIEEGNRDHKVYDKYDRESEHDDNRDYNTFHFEKRKASKKIEGLEVNSPEGRDNLRKSITEGYISRSKMEEEDIDHKREAKGIQELDFSNCHRCSPSYRLLPDDYLIPTASQRSELGTQVLNDHWVSVTSGSEDYSFKHMRRNQYEESLFRCEDDRFELDMLLESVSSTAKRVEELLKNINDSKVHLDSLRRVEGHFSALNIRCIERLYGDHGLEVMDMLRKNPTLALRVILTRLKQKQDEWTRCQADFNKVWAEIYAKNHYKSLDHRSFYFKQQDSKTLSAKCLVAEIKELKEKNQEDNLLLAVAAAHRQPLAPHLEYEYPDAGLHDDLYKLVQYSCEELCSTREELNKVLRLWTIFLESMLGVQLQSRCVKGTENAGKAKNTAINSNISSLAEYNETGFPAPQNTDVNSRLHKNVNACDENCPPERSNSCHNVFVNGRTMSTEHLGGASRDGLKVEKEGKNVDVADKRPGLSVHSSSKEVVNSIASLANAAEDSHGQNNIDMEIGCGADASRFTDTACEDRQIEVVMDRAAQLEVADAATSVHSENIALANYGDKISRSIENSIRSSKIEKEEGELSPSGDLGEDNFIAYREADVEVTPKRKHGIESMQYQSANSEERHCEDQGGENDFNANADFEDSKNVCDDASGSDSARDECSREEHEHEEDVEHDEIDGNAETEGLADGLADPPFVGGPLPSDRILLSVRPLTKQVNAAVRNGERHDVRTFYANDDFYVLFRLHQILYERILSAKANCTDAEMQRNTFKDMSSSDHYGRFMSALYNLLDGSVGNTKFEDECRAIIGNQSYILFTLDKLIYKLVKQLQTVAMDETDNKIVQLYEYEKSRKPGWTIDSVYYEDACVLLYEENIYRIESSSSPTRLSMQLMNHVIEKPEAFALSVNPTFLEYLHNDLLSVSPSKKEAHGIALRRNMRKYVGLDDHAANCVAMEDVELINGLECKISCRSCKISYVMDTEDFFFRRRNTSQCRSPSKIQARRERFHGFLSASYR